MRGVGKRWAEDKDPALKLEMEASQEEVVLGTERMVPQVGRNFE